VTPVDRLSNPDAILTRTDVAALGWNRRGVDAVFRGCPVVALPGYSRPVVRVRDYLAFLDEHTFTDKVARVQP
jgi:hypothetical protein